MRDDVDVLVVGAGLAGLHTATLLARRGHDVLLAERRPTLTGAIRTTPLSTTHTEVTFFSWCSAVNGTAISGAAVVDENCTIAVMPSRTSGCPGGIDTVTA